MADALEAEIDRLFQLPLADVVNARNALVERLRKAGDRAGVARIKEIRRPTPAAWAINQLHHQRVELFERALSQTAALRALHARDGVGQQPLTAAVDEQRNATQALVLAALRCCEQAGLPAGPAQERKILTTVQGWLAGSAGEAPGRMTHDIEPAGFGAIANVGAPRVEEAAPQPLPLSIAPAPLRVVASSPDRRALERAATAVTEHEQRARVAGELVEQREAQRLRVASELQRVQANVQQAEQDLAGLRAQLVRCEQDLGQAVVASAQARTARDEAVEAVANARAGLAELQK